MSDDGVVERGPVRSTKPHTPETDYVAKRLEKSSIEVNDPDLGVQMRIAATGLRSLEAERDALRAQVAELVGLLRDAEALRPRMLKDFGYVPEYVLEFCNKARAVLYRVKP